LIIDKVQFNFKNVNAACKDIANAFKQIMVKFKLGLTDIINTFDIGSEISTESNAGTKTIVFKMEIKMAEVVQRIDAWIEGLLDVEQKLDVEKDEGDYYNLEHRTLLNMFIEMKQSETDDGSQLNYITPRDLVD